MFVIKACSKKRNRGVALVLLGSSFAIQMTPPMLRAWASVFEVSDGAAMAAISLIYFVLLVVVMVKGRNAKV